MPIARKFIKSRFGKKYILFRSQSGAPLVVFETEYILILQRKEPSSIAFYR